MSHRKYVPAAILIAAGAAVAAAGFADASDTTEPATTVTVGDAEFDEFLERYEAANSAFLNGDPSLWQSMVTGEEPASIFGGFGGLGEAGVTTVNERYALASTAFEPSGAEASFEYLVKDVQGTIAYTVAIERADVRFAGQDDVLPQVLRVTMIFRYEHGEWRIIHRHADTMTELELPTA